MVGNIVELFNKFGFTTRVLAASFMNVQQVYASMMVGTHAVTVNMDTFENSLKHPLTDYSVDRFIQDWEGVYGEGKTTYNI